MHTLLYTFVANDVHDLFLFGHFGVLSERAKATRPHFLPGVVRVTSATLLQAKAAVHWLTRVVARATTNTDRLQFGLRPHSSQ